MENKYGFGETVELPFDEAVQAVIIALKNEGFGVLTEIDVAETLKEKIDYDMPRYKILGACNPPFAKRALEAEPTIGLLMPCNVVVREDQEGVVHVEFMDPAMMGSLTDKPELEELAQEVRERLIRVKATF